MKKDAPSNTTVSRQKGSTPRSTKPNKRIVLRILDLLSHGLTSGLGNRKPGQMCVEAAICFAYDLPHGDEPPCVGSAVRAFKIKLNDCQWSSNQARAEGMKRLAIAQLGSDALNQMEFGKRMYVRSTQKLLSHVLRLTGDKQTNTEKRDKYHDLAKQCEAVTTVEEARKAAKDADAYADADADAYAYDTYTYAYASADAYAYASADAYASASADAYADAYADFRKNDTLLLLTAQVGLDVLKEMKAPGCKWLHLAEASPVPNANGKPANASY